MQSTKQASVAATIGRGVVAGVAGTVVMTAFQKFVEMPVTGREDSYAPATLPSEFCRSIRAAMRVANG